VNGETKAETKFWLEGRLFLIRPSKFQPSWYLIEISQKK